MTQLKPGMVVDGRFTLKRRLGAGSTGAVWVASDAKAGGEDVALKLLHPQMADDRQLVAQLEREASVLTQLAHPNIARPIVFSADGAFVYLAMELVDGRALHEELGERSRQRRPYRARELASLFGQLTSAVAYAHAKWIVHRDLKPHNVIVTAHDDELGVKVVDFGIARLLEGSLFEATTLGRQLGSLFYMSPEQTRGEPADARSDVFALGSILFELLTLHRAWAWDPEGRPLPAFAGPLQHREANALASVVERIARAPRPRPSALRPELFPAFDDLVTRALAVRAADRYASVAELAEDAAQALAQLARREEAEDDGVTAATIPAQGGESAAPVTDELPAPSELMATQALGLMAAAVLTDPELEPRAVAPLAALVPEPAARAPRAVEATRAFVAASAPAPELGEGLEDAGPTVLSRTPELLTEARAAPMIDTDRSLAPRRPSSVGAAPTQVPELVGMTRVMVEAVVPATRVPELGSSERGAPRPRGDAQDETHHEAHDPTAGERGAARSRGDARDDTHHEAHEPVASDLARPNRTVIAEASTPVAKLAPRRTAWLFAAVTLIGVSAALLAAQLLFPREPPVAIQPNRSVPHLPREVLTALSALAVHPGRRAELDQLRDAIVAAAAAVRDPEEQRRIRELAREKAAAGDGPGLAQCARLLETALE
jgi:hypothetical protein